MKYVSALLLVLCFLSGSATALAEENKDPNPRGQDDTQWAFTEKKRTITVNNQPLHFTARIVEAPLFNQQNELQGRMHAFSYTLDPEQHPASSPRPITFLFNGGPGSSSVWLHLGAFGPYRVGLDDEGVALGPPYTLNENPNTLLPNTDLVFIDPITTGHSRAAKGVDAGKTFRNVSGDLRSIAQFIYRYLTVHEAWDRPVYLGGESYGTTRAAGLTKVLQDQHGIYPAGVILVSAVLDFSTIHYGPMNDRAFAGILPTYAALAHYHGENRAPAQDLEDIKANAENAVAQTYWPALLTDQQDDLAERAGLIGSMIGIDPGLLEKTKLRLHPSRFRSELLQDETRVLGRFDGRYTLPDTDPANPWPNIDPSYNLVHGAFTAGIHQLMAMIGYENQSPYEILKGGNWDFESEGRPLETASRLSAAMNANPNLKVYVASGIYDLATPYYAARMTIDRYVTEPGARARFTFVDFPAGHMMFVHRDSQEKLSASIAAWMDKNAVSHDE